MNNIRKINDINQRELSQNVSYAQSWHYDYRDTNYIYVGNIPVDHMNSIDIVKIFSQYGVPTHIHFFDGKESEQKQRSGGINNQPMYGNDPTRTGGAVGFAFVKYENFKSCVLAIDNFNGIEVLDGKKLKVDHCYYKLRGGEQESDYLIDYSAVTTTKTKQPKEPKALIEDRKLSLLEEAPNDTAKDDELKDPMEAFLTKKELLDEELKDPMEQYLSQKSTSKRSTDKHRSSHRHRRHKHSDHSDRHSSNKDSKAREKSPRR